MDKDKLQKVNEFELTKIINIVPDSALARGISTKSAVFSVIVIYHYIAKERILWLPIMEKLFALPDVAVILVHGCSVSSSTAATPSTPPLKISVFISSLSFCCNQIFKIDLIIIFLLAAQGMRKRRSIY